MSHSLTDDELANEIGNRSGLSGSNLIIGFGCVPQDQTKTDYLNGALYIIDEEGETFGEHATEFINASIPDNTKKAYLGDLKYFFSWYRLVVSKEKANALSDALYNWLPPSFCEEDILKFIFHHLQEMPPDIENKLIAGGLKKKKGPNSLATVKRRLVSLEVYHKMHKFSSNHWNTPKTKNLLSAMSKTCDPQKRSRAITKTVLENLLEVCEGDGLIGIRDKALLLFGFSSGGRRRSEIADAMLVDLESESTECYIYRLPKSKTDQEGKGHEVPLKGRAAKALKIWLDAANITEGKIFRSIKKGGKRIGDSITAVDINRIVKKRCKEAGYDPVLYSAHSLRSGFVTEAGKQGCPIGDVMQMTAHTNVNTVMKYYRAGSAINNKAADLM